MQVKAVWAVKVVPDEETEGLHEFSLSWYRFTDDPSQFDPVIKLPAVPAVWVKFGSVKHLELMQRHFPEAKLGPSSRFTEALILTEDRDKALELKEKIEGLFGKNDEEEGMDQIIKEDTLEDY